MGSSQSALNFGAGPAKLPREVSEICKVVLNGIKHWWWNKMGVFYILIYIILLLYIFLKFKLIPLFTDFKYLFEKVKRLLGFFFLIYLKLLPAELSLLLGIISIIC